jgi:predicted MFS family arabinose efflux permease
LAGKFPEENIWILYTAGSILGLILNFSLTKFLKKVGINRLFVSVSVLTILNSLLLSLNNSPQVVYLEFILYYGVSAVLFTFASIILEEYSRENKTGGIRGIYNATMSGGYLLAPLFSSFCISLYGIESVFQLSSFFGFAALATFFFFLYPVRNLSLKNENLSLGLKKVMYNPDLRNILISQIGLTTFYTLIVIYLPFKLTELGIPLTTYLGVMLPVALTPFLFLPPLLGHLEDKVKDEKEILIGSYIGLIFIIALIAFYESNSVFTWTVLLFLSRLFASSMEISNHSYFYKKTKAENVSLISIFLSVEYAVTIFFTGVFSAIVYLTDIKTLFLSVSFFLCFVLVYVSKIDKYNHYEKHKNWQIIWEKTKKRLG